MNPSELKMCGESIFRCDSCERPTNDFYILPDGSVVCVDCAQLWERNRAKQN